MPRKRKPPIPGPGRETDRISYRELRNTPGRVWERLARDEPLTLVAEGEAKAVVIPLIDGDPRSALEAYRRGRAMMAIARIRRQARESGAAQMTLAQVNALIQEVREERGRQHRRK